MFIAAISVKHNEQGRRGIIVSRFSDKIFQIEIGHESYEFASATGKGGSTNGSKPFLELIAKQGYFSFFSLNSSNQANDPEDKISKAENPVLPVEIAEALQEIDNQCC